MTTGFRPILPSYGYRLSILTRRGTGPVLTLSAV